MQTRYTQSALQYGISLALLSSTLSYAKFIPNAIITETSSGVKPRIMLILDNSGSMIMGSSTSTHPTFSWMSRSEILYESVMFLAKKYTKDANFGISILNAQTKNYMWPSALLKGKSLNTTLKNIFNSPYKYSHGFYKNINTNSVAPACSNWETQKMGIRSAGVIMDILNLETSTNMTLFEQHMRAIGPHNSTPLASSINRVHDYFRLNNAKTKPIQYRCQRNHILMFTDGEANPGEAPQAAAKTVWDTNYLPAYGVDMANKPWKSNGMIKQNISFHGIFFGLEKLDQNENPALTNLKDAASYSKGMVVNANTLDSLKAAFAKIIDTIVITRSGTGGTYGTEDPLHLTNENKKDIYYRTTFAFKDWTSIIQAERPDDSVLWSSLNTIKFKNEAGAGTAGSEYTQFNTYLSPYHINIASILSFLPKSLVTIDDIKWLMGSKISKLRARSTPLSDIIGSKATYSGKGLSLIPGYMAYADARNEIDWNKYQVFKAQYCSSFLLIGSNDGLFNLIDPVTGHRKYAFLPPSMFARIATLTDPNYVHTYGIDGQTIVADTGVHGCANTIAVTGYGGGGKGYFAVKLFGEIAYSCNNRINFLIPKILWEVNDSALGYTYGQPHIVRTDDPMNQDIIVANGYDAPNKQTSLLRYSTSGTLKNEYVTKNTDNTPYLEGGGLSTPEIITDSEGLLLYAYAGDLKGNLWKFDFTQGYDTNQVKIFKLFTDINGKPITTKPLIVKRENNLIIIFGSGKYLEKSDHEGSNEKALHHLYGILDNNLNIFITEKELQAQKLIPSTQKNKFDVTSNDVDYSKQKGWYLPLTLNPLAPTGDRLIFDPSMSSTNKLVRFSLAAYKNSISNDPCLSNDANLTGKTIELYPFSGGKPVGDKMAGDISEKPIGTTEIHNYDDAGNILNISKITVEKPSHSGSKINPTNPNSSNFGSIQQTSKDENGIDKETSTSIGRGNDMNGNMFLITNTFNSLKDPCEIYIKACEDTKPKKGNPMIIYTHFRF